ncbi:hypothetical protein A6R68_12626, partial [Neotoma lepida]
GAVAQPGYGSVRSSNQNSGGSSSGGGNSGSNGDHGSSSNSHSSSSNSHGSSSNSHGSSSNSHGNSGHGNSGGGNSGSGSREIETSNFDEGYSVSRCDNPGDDERTAGGSRSQESRESSRLLGGSHDYQEHGSNGDGERNEAVSGLKAMNSDPSSLPFNFDSFWE